MAKGWKGKERGQGIERKREREREGRGKKGEWEGKERKDKDKENCVIIGFLCFFKLYFLCFYHFMMGE